MNKQKSIILIITILLILCPCCSLLTMKPVDTGNVLETGIIAIKNGNGTSYLVGIEEGYVLFDAGTDAEKFESSLNDIGIDPEQILWVFLTHSDSDHVAALKILPNAKIFMGMEEIDLVTGKAKRSMFFTNKMPENVDLSQINLLTDGQELDFDEIYVKCIAAPGHTHGSMAYLINDKYLITGDAFKVSGGNLGVHPFTMDSNESKKTIEKLRNIVNSSQIVLTSHYGIIKN